MAPVLESASLVLMNVLVTVRQHVKVRVQEVAMMNVQVARVHVPAVQEHVWEQVLLLRKLCQKK